MSRYGHCKRCGKHRFGVVLFFAPAEPSLFDEFQLDNAEIGWICFANILDTALAYSNYLLEVLWWCCLPSKSSLVPLWQHFFLAWISSLVLLSLKLKEKLGAIFFCWKAFKMIRSKLIFVSQIIGFYVLSEYLICQHQGIVFL